MSFQPLTPGLMIVHGNQPESLRQLIVHWFRQYPLAPLEDELILVHSNGMAQWLKMALANDEDDPQHPGCGIAAALDIRLPSRFLWQAYRCVLGVDQVPDSSPFDKPLLTWRLMRLLPECLAEDAFRPLARYLAGDDDLLKRYQLAERIADLFDQYQVYRADWLQAWEQGQDILIDTRGQSHPLTDHQRWQACLWRAICTDVGTTGNETSRASVHQRFLSALASPHASLPRPDGLPRRITVFGITSLPRQQLEVLVALAGFCQILVCVHNPCRYFWADIISAQDAWRQQVGRHVRKAGMPANLDPDSLHTHAHPLLAAWGKLGRDYIALLDELDDPEGYRMTFAGIGQRIDLFDSPGHHTLLRQLQDDILELRPVSESRQLWPAVIPAEDHSLRFHVCHSPQREMEILQDQLLAAMDSDPTLTPRDIIVMVPDINIYAPHIAAVFGRTDARDPRHIPFAISDQGTRHQRPLAQALEFLLSLPDNRLGISDMLDLLDVPAVQTRLGLDTLDLPLLKRWIEHSQIRWGLDADHRQRWITNAVAGDNPQQQNTWLFGLKRMLLGYAVGSDPSGRTRCDWHGIEPEGEIGGLDAHLIGPLARLLTRLTELLALFSRPASPTEWVSHLQQLLQDFFQPSDTDEQLLLLQWQESLDDWLGACQSAGLTEALPLTVVREHWLAQLDQAGTGQHFMAGRLTFATLLPMRNIPFRMVCLLGMNDGDYPRSHPPCDFDLMSGQLRPGDRSRREDDRYLFLEALLAARERLYISWIGRNIHDNGELPPSVLVSQLREHVDRGWHVATDPNASVSASLTTVHPLHAFSRSYFDGSQPGLFTYAHEWERISCTPSSCSQQALPPIRLPDEISLDQLARFLRDPARCFFNERLRVHYDADMLTSEDQEPFTVNGLTLWQHQDELIQARLDAIGQQAVAGKPATCEVQAMHETLDRQHRRGTLPLGAHAELVRTALQEGIDALFSRYHTARQHWNMACPPVQMEHPLNLNGHTILISGRIDNLFTRGDGTHARISVSSSSLLANNSSGSTAHYRPDKLAHAWVLHVATNILLGPTQSLIIGRNGEAPLQPLDPEHALAYLSDLVAAYAAGLDQPLPFTLRSAYSWLSQGGSPCYGQALTECLQTDAVKAARSSYEGSSYQAGEVGHNPYLQRSYPDFASLWSNGAFSQWSSRLAEPLRNHLGQIRTASGGV